MRHCFVWISLHVVHTGLYVVWLCMLLRDPVGHWLCAPVCSQQCILVCIFQVNLSLWPWDRKDQWRFLSTNSESFLPVGLLVVCIYNIVCYLWGQKGKRANVPWKARFSWWNFLDWLQKFAETILCFTLCLTFLFHLTCGHSHSFLLRLATNPS